MSLRFEVGCVNCGGEVEMVAGSAVSATRSSCTTVCTVCRAEALIIVVLQTVKPGRIPAAARAAAGG